MGGRIHTLPNGERQRGYRTLLTGPRQTVIVLCIRHGITHTSGGLLLKQATQRAFTLMSKVAMMLFLATPFAFGREVVFEPFDASWEQRWWFFARDGYALGVTQTRAQGTEGRTCLDVTGRGSGYGIVQTRHPLARKQIASTEPVPTGISFHIRGTKAGSFVFELEGNRRTVVAVDASGEWKSIEIPFTRFSPAITYSDIAGAGFAQFSLGGEIAFQIAAIGWLYPEEYPASSLADLEVASFRAKYNLEYNPLEKASSSTQLKSVGRGLDGYVATEAGPPGAPPSESRVTFEVNGVFDEGGCPDWRQAHAVVIELRATRKARLSIRFFRKETQTPFTSAEFVADTAFQKIRVRREAFTGQGLSGEIAAGGIFMPADVGIRLRSVGVAVPEGMFLAEMQGRGQKRTRHFHWRLKALHSNGLSPFKAIEEAVDAFDRCLAERRFGEYAAKAETVDIAYWYGIELLALRAMNAANADRAAAAMDQVSLKEIQSNGTAIERIVSAVGRSCDMPALGKLCEDENVWCNKTMALCRERDLRPHVRGRRYYSPSGTPITLYGTHSFVASRKGMRSGLGLDNMYKRLVALGFNGIRFEAEEYRFMPTEAGVDGAVVAAYREGIEAAWRYGLWVQYDNHFYWPGWATRNRCDGYQNLPATIRIWDATARALADMKNILVFETPSNEPAFYDNGSGRSILDIPSMMAEWNQFLKRRYSTRDALNDAWTRNVEHPRENSLRPEEGWDKNTIQPPGFTERRLDDMKNQSTRVWDWLMFARHIQSGTTGAISETVRRYIPTATFMQQFIIGSEWDRSPLPMNYLSIHQAHADEHIFIGSHYGPAGRQVLKAVALGTPSTDSETPAEGHYHDYLVQKLMDSGVCLFADFARWGGGMLWENDECDFKESTSYVPLIADFYKNAEPLAPRPKAQVIVIEPTRLTATMQNDSVGAVIATLDKARIEYRLFEENHVIDHPAVLDEFAYALINVTFANTALLDALKQSRIKTFVFGSPYRDAYCRVWPEGIAGWFVKNGLFVRSWAEPANVAPVQSNTIGLEGSIRFRYDEKKAAAAEGWQAFDFDDSKWERKPVPAYWGELEIIGSRRYFLGDGWYRFHVDIPADWRDRVISLNVGAIDDTDEAFLNGTSFGKTTTATANWWTVPRSYVLPQEYIRFGARNLIAIKVTNAQGNAGIWRGPVTLVTHDSAKARVTADFGFLRRGDSIDVATGRENFYPSVSGLSRTSQSLAIFGADRAAILRDGNFVFCGLATQITAQPLHETLILSFLKDSGMPLDYPVKAEARLHAFTKGYYVVQGFPDAETQIEIKGNHFEHVGMEVLRAGTPRDGRILFGVPKDAIALIRVWD